MKEKHAGMGAMAALIMVMVFTAEISALSSGYILTAAYGGTKTVLFDTLGNATFQWDHSTLPNKQCGYSCYLLKNGNLLRTAIVPEKQVVSTFAPRQGIIEEIDPKGAVVWRHTLANDTFMTHHDIKPMPNGHVLAISFVAQTKAQMAATGVDTSLVANMKNPVFILSEKIVEIDPTAADGPKIVWEWKMYDHIIKGDSAAAHPELISGSITKALFYTNQWVHLNGLDYNEKLDMVLFSSRVFSELYIIDHGTTTEEAAGHTGGKRGKGGDILYRWGKPGNYKMTGGTTINVLHCVNWVPEGYPGAGNIMFFHNNISGGSQSQVIEVKPPMDANGNFIKTAGQAFGPEQPTWLYAPTSKFFSQAMSSALRLPNGNTLAHLAYPSSSGGMDLNGSSIVQEISPEKQVVWTDTIALKGEAVEAANPSKFNPAKIMYYPKDYEGISKLLGVKNRNTAQASASMAAPVLRRSAGTLIFKNAKGYDIAVYSLQGRKLAARTFAPENVSIATGTFPAGTYMVKMSSGNGTEVLENFNVVK